MESRLQKILSRYGISSRRAAEVMILSGRVKVNGALVSVLGTCADPDRDWIEVDDKPLISPPELCYLLLHKPIGLICTRKDPQKRKTIYDILPLAFHHLFSVGRLDSDSSGALLLTNDGNLANQWTHPQHHISKHYEVLVKGEIIENTLCQWREGVLLDDQITLPAQVDLIGCENNCSLIKIVLREGRNRQIRKVASILHHPVISLHRTQIGPIGLNHLPEGAFRLITPSEVLAI